MAKNYEVCVPHHLKLGRRVHYINHASVYIKFAVPTCPKRPDKIVEGKYYGTLSFELFQLLPTDTLVDHSGKLDMHEYSDIDLIEAT